MVEIIRYENEHFSIWNNFINNSKNGTFLLDRSYMEYHSDRFQDHSLMFYIKGKLYAVFPANINQDQLISHQGLTYGSMIVDEHINTKRMLDIFTSLKNYCKEKKIKTIIYKAIPHIYHKAPCEEDLYALFYHDASLLKREISTSFMLAQHELPYKKRSAAKKAEKSGAVIEESNNLKAYFEIVNKRLNDKYAVSAVHSSDEMSYLISKFPSNIKFYSMNLGDEMIGGSIIYETDEVAHLQYLHTSDKGRSIRALDFMIQFLSQEYSGLKSWFDFGISTESGGKYLNESLIKQKEEFNAAGICYDTYQINL